MNDSTSTTLTASSSERWTTPNGDIRDLDLNQPASALDVLREHFTAAGWVREEPETTTTPLDWFEDFGIEDDVASWELRTELDGHQSHSVSTLLDAADPDVRVLPAYAPCGSFSIPELMTFIEELQRCLTAARYIAGMKAVAA